MTGRKTKALLVRDAAPASASPTTRDLILDAAERRFAERGFGGVSMRRLAAAAGLKNQASLYNHFRNKRALYEAVLARGIKPIVQVIADRTGEPPPVGRADREPRGADGLIDLVLDYLAAHPHLPRLIQRAALDDGGQLRHALNRLLRPLYGQGMRVLAADGRWQPAELPHLAAGLYQLIFGYFANAKLLEAVVGQDPLSPAALTRQRRFLRAAVAQLVGTRGPSGRRSAPSRAPHKRRASG